MKASPIVTKKNEPNEEATEKKLNLLNANPISRPPERTINRKEFHHKTAMISPTKAQRTVGRRRMTKRENTEEENRINSVKELYHRNKRSSTFRTRVRLNLAQEPILPMNLINKFAYEKHEEKVCKLYHILEKSYAERSLKEQNDLLNFLLETKISETLKSDLLITDLSVSELFQHFKQFMSMNMFNYFDTLYYKDEESVNYYVLLEGEIGQYKLEMFEEEFTCEEYLMFLFENYKNYESEKQIKNVKERTKSKIIIKRKDNIENKEKKEKNENKDKKEKDKIEKIEKNEEIEKEEYIDDYLLCHMIEENKDVFPLHETSDLTKIPKIILKIKLFMTLNEEQKPLNAQALFYKYDIPLTYLNFDKCLYGLISVPKYIQNLLSNFQERDHFYMRNFSAVKRQVKCYKYVKCAENLKPYSHFGNFELVDFEPKRNCTTRCESEYCIVLYFNKLLYSQIMYKLQKKQREKELENIHSYSLFRNISQRVYVRKIFSKFQIKNYFKDDVLFTQGSTLNNFIFIKEGIIELSLQNMTLFEFNKLINYIKEIIIKRAKDYNINPKEILDFNTEVEKRSSFNLKTRKEILFKRQNFLFQLSEKGFYGEIELFFKLNALLSATVVSDKCLLYSYSFDKFRSLNEETFFINENLKNGAFSKLKSLIKRMITVYNSYWLLSVEQVNKKINDEKILLNGMNVTELKQSVPPLHVINPFSFGTLIGKNKGKIINNETNNDWNNRNRKSTSIFENNNNNIQSPKMTGRYPFLPSVNKNPQNNSKVFERQKIKVNSSMQKPRNKNIFNEEKSISFDSENKKTSINSEDYYNKLFATFKIRMLSQMIAPKKKNKKIFLPPILSNIPALSNYQIFTEQNNSLDNSKNNDNDINHKINSEIKRNASDTKFNLVICNNENQKSTSDIKNDEKSERDGLNNKKGKPEKNRHHKVANLLVAQLNIIKYKANRNKNLTRNNVNSIV